MKKLTKKQFNLTKTFILSNARQLDIDLIKYIFENGNVEDVLNSLSKYQNEDGGFGHGLEPDLRTGLSSNIATTIAFHYFDKLIINKFPDFLENALKYFENNYSSEYKCWIPITKESDKSPHAIWWGYNLKQYISEAGWGNPTIEIIGYLLQFKNNFNNNELEMLKQKALERLFSSNELETHELMCYQRFTKSLSEQEQGRVNQKLNELITNQIEHDSSKWNSYVPRPLNFVDSPKSPFYSSISAEVEAELDFLIDTMDSTGGWYPNWEWRQFDEEWKKVKPEIAGMLSVKNLLILKNFERI